MVRTPNYDLDIDTTLGGSNASDYIIPSQKAIKSYVDNSTGGNVMWGGISGTLSNQTDLQNALNNADEIFDATYGTTTFADISDALTNGKVPVCHYNDKIYIYSLTSGSVHYFTAVYAPYIYVLRCYENSSNWNTVVYTLEQTANKKTSISSASTDTQYPSAKCVYDELQLKQDTLESGTNIKTINNNSILGSGNLVLDGLPSQTGQSGKFLTTDGTDASWATVTIPTPTYDSVNERITW